MFCYSVGYLGDCCVIALDGRSSAISHRESVTVASSRGVLSVVVELSLSVSFCYLTEQGDKANRQPHPSVKSTQTFAYALLFRG